MSTVSRGKPVKYEVDGVATPGRTSLHIQPEETFKPFRFHLSGDLEKLSVVSIKVGVVEQMLHELGRRPEPVPAEIFVRVEGSPVWLAFDTCDSSLLFSVELVNDGDGDAKVKMELEGDSLAPRGLSLVR